MENELVIGSVGASLFITIVLGLIYKSFNVSNKWKPWIAIILGIGFAFLTMVYTSIPFIAKNIIDYGINGFMVGATAVGLNELGFKKVIPGKKKSVISNVDYNADKT
jgi:hypothetical protein